MTARTKTRAPRSPSGTAANCQSPRGRRVQLSEAALLSALEAGADVNTIAAANRCSPRTVARRIAAARAEHGHAWGRPLVPEPSPEPKPLPPSAPPWGELTTKARALFNEVLEGRASATKLLPHQIAVARSVLSIPPPAEATQDAEADHAALLAQVQRATAPPPELDLAPEASPSSTDTHDDEGAPDA